MGAHGAVIHLQHRDANHHDDGQQGVEIVGDGPDKNGEPVLSGNKTGHSRGPGGDGGDDAHGGCRGVDQVGQLGPGDVVLVCHRTHNAPHCQAVKIVVDKDQHAQKDGGKLGPCPRLDVFLRPLAEGGRASHLVHHADHDAKDDKEHDNPHIVAVGEHRDDASLENVSDGSLKGKSRVKNAADQNSDKQGAVHLLGDQGQHDGHKGRQERPGCGKHPGDVLCLLPSRKAQERTAGHKEHDSRERPQNFSLYIPHKYLPLLYKDK